MAILTANKKRTWYFWYAIEDYSVEILVDQYECIKPSRTSIAKDLLKRFNAGEFKRYGWTIDKQNP